MADNKTVEYVVKIKADTKLVDDALDRVGKDAGETAGEVKKMSSVFDNFKNKLKAISNIGIGKQQKADIDNMRTSYKNLADDIAKANNDMSKASSSVSRNAKATEKSYEGVASATATARNNLQNLSTTGLPEIPKDLLQARNTVQTLRNLITSLKFPNLRIGYFSREADVLRSKIAQVESEMAKLAQQRIKTDDWIWTEQEIAKVNAKLDGYYAKMERMKHFGVSTEKQFIQWRQLQYDIKQAQKQLNDLIATQEIYKSMGNQYVSGASTEKYAAKESQLATLRASLAELESQGESVSLRLGRTFLKQLSHGIGNGIKSGARIAKGGFNNLIKMSKSLLKFLGKITGASKLMQKTMHTNRYGLLPFAKMMLQFQLISTVFRDAKTSFDTLAKSSDSFNKAISSMVISLRVFGAQLISAFAPLMEFVAPYVATIAQIFTQAMDKMAQFTARLTGKDTYTKAQAGNYDYAKSLDKTASGAKKATKSVKEYQNTVMGFDELNKLNGRDTGVEDILSDIDLEKTQTKATALNKIADEIYKNLKAKNFKGAGKAVADGINSAFAWMKNVAGWEKNGKKITGVLAHVIDFTNGMLQGLDGLAAGNAIGDVINTVIHSLEQLTDAEKGIDFKLAGLRVGQTITSAFMTIDWSALGMTIVQGVQAVIAFANGIFTTPDFWSSIGVAIGDGIKGMLSAFNPTLIADTFVAFVHGIAEMLLTAFGGGNADIGVRIGTAIAETINRIFTTLSPAEITAGINAFVSTVADTIRTIMAEVDWSQIISTLGQVIGGLDWGSILTIGATMMLFNLPALVSTFGGTIISCLGSAFSGVGQMLAPKIAELGAKLLPHITSLGAKFLPKLASFGSTLVSALFSPVGLIIAGVVAAIAVVVANLDGFKAVFENFGAGLKETFGGIVSNISNLFGAIGDFFNGTISGVDLLKSVVSSVGNVLGSFGSIFIEPIKLGVDLIGAAFDGLGNIFHGLGDKVGGVFGNILHFLGDLSYGIGDFCESISDAFGVIIDACRHMGDVIVGVFDWVKEKIGSVWDWIQGKVDAVGNFFGGIGDFFGGRSRAVSYEVQARNIPQLAGGGIVGDGQLFIANENGPEMVGRYGNSTAVANNGQIVQAVVSGVKAAMMEAIMMANNTSTGNSGDIVLYVDSEELARASLRGQRSIDRKSNAVMSFV